MPKIDLTTGCQVMTTAEFWNSQADIEGEGRTGGECFEDFLDDWAKEGEKERDRLRDTEQAFSFLKEMIDNWIDSDPDFESEVPMPTEVARVLDVKFKATMGGNKTKLRLIAKAEDGEMYIYDVWFQYWAGSMMDPPEEDGEIDWIPLKCVIL